MKWVVDNSEAFSRWDTDIPDVLLIGGVLGECKQLACLESRLIQIKREYSSDPSFPVKWNFKDLKKHFRSIDREDLFKELLNNSDGWRTQMAEAIVECEAMLIVSCILCLGLKRDALKSTRTELTGAVFSNGLQRVGLHARDHSASSVEVVLDWPDKGQPAPFNNEYASAFYQGTSTSGEKYLSGRLSELGFSDSVSFRTMTSSGLLQYADLVVGASRELLDVVEDRKTPGTGIEVLRIVAPRFRGYPDNIIGRGFVVSPTRSPIVQRIKDGLDGLGA